ncbi:MAG TPA: MBL fold metallo-hydrolase [Thermoplasmata archaeon]|nr:MBL fold metallo-hydrolase [Thermoplasmata archaeon]
MASSADSLPHPFVRPPRTGSVPLISPADLHHQLDSATPPLLLDVRPLSERRLVHIPGDRHVPLHALGAALSSLPHDRPIVAYDHFGSQARSAVRFLQDRGFPLSAALEGGVDEYSRVVDADLARYPEDDPTARLYLRQIPRPDSGCLTYLLGDTVEREAIIIDPGREVAPYRALLAEDGWRLVGIVETHTHADHLAGHSALHAATDAPIYLGRRSPARYPHRSFAEGESVRFGNEEAVVLETPGHTPDHVTLRVHDKIFTGDTLLLGSCGRTDLGEGSPEALYASLTEKILTLPPETEVYPAHYGARHALPERYVSTVGFERVRNEALTQGSLEAFVRYMTEGWPPKPADFDRIVRTNLDE